MSNYLFRFAAYACLLLTMIAYSYADSDHGGVGLNYNKEGLSAINADSHAPIGVMGEHMHNKGEWMFSYRYMYMDMEDSRIGDDEVTPEFIATSVPNRFFGTPGQPPTLRVVPTEMSMHMHMFGAMYAPSDRVTLMAMLMYQEKSMNHITFAGPAGTTRLGTFTTETRGMGDTKLSGMIRLFENDTHHIHLNAGFSLPTGDNKKTDAVLTPMGTRPNLRLPYPMQLGSGTIDLLPGLTYTGKHEQFGWGAQYMATVRTGRDEGYSLGDRHDLSSWFSYRWRPWISTSMRVAYYHEGQIDGIDPNIVAPVQTADPDNQGGDVVNLYFGLNLAGQHGRLRGHRIAMEAGIPLHRDLNGPQLETDLTLTAGWQYAF